MKPITLLLILFPLAITSLVLGGPQSEGGIGQPPPPTVELSCDSSRVTLDASGGSEPLTGRVTLSCDTAVSNSVITNEEANALGSPFSCKGCSVSGDVGCNKSIEGTSPGDLTFMAAGMTPSGSCIYTWTTTTAMFKIGCLACSSPGDN